ncbi:MAG: hypothetical protein R3D67_18345 [Hyphomicrobiaceae bacterium]
MLAIFPSLDCSSTYCLVRRFSTGFCWPGLLALLALGLNLVFGVIDVVWICYAGLV